MTLVVYKHEVKNKLNVHENYVSLTDLQHSNICLKIHKMCIISQCQDTSMIVFLSRLFWFSNRSQDISKNNFTLCLYF